jgi:hypothetical protein
MKNSPHRSTLVVSLASVALCPFLRADVVINEIHHEPLENHDPVEFVELFNSGNAIVDVSGWSLTDAVEYSFPAGTTIEASGYLVVAEDPEALKASYAADALGPWTGQILRLDDQGNIIEQRPGRLNNDGERVVLQDATGTGIDQVDYKVRFPWPIGSGGDGGSMELINPVLDNNLGSSWRTSLAPGLLPEATLLAAGSSWQIRRGDSEASDPIDAWRGAGFFEDGSWFNGQSPVGFGGVTGVEFNTTITDMQNVHTGTFARSTFQVALGEIPARLLVRMQVDDGLILWINGEEVARFQVEGDPTFASKATKSGDEGEWEEEVIEGVGAYIKEGTNTIAVQAFNSSIGGSDFGFDVEIIRPAPEAEPVAEPTPGRVNSVFAENAAPNIRQVNHSPKMPKEDEKAVITAKVTDPDGVASVKLLYQVNEPGSYIPARLPFATRDLTRHRHGQDYPRERNPEFEDPANWTTLEMKDDGAGKDALAADAIFTVEMPAFKHRRLVRYRIIVEDTKAASDRAPFVDDPSFNFAYFVYNGVPDYQAEESVANNDGPHTYPAEQLTELPVYHLITRNDDWLTCMAYSRNQLGKATKAALTFNWDGAFIYDGIVYDHIRYRLRGANGRHQGSGKRSMKYKFNRGNHLRAKDQNGKDYVRTWRILTTAKGFGNRQEPSYGLIEAINPFLFRLAGVPAPMTHWYHFRLIDGEEEAVDQHNGDFQGHLLAQERYDSRFLDQHGLKTGNIYKLSDTVNDSIRLRRYLANGAIDDGTDHRLTKSEFARRQTEEWLRNHANMDLWYRWSAVKEAIRHYDWPSPSDKNMGWYFEPPFTEENDFRGKLWLLPYDYDDTWGPAWNGGNETIKNGITRAGSAENTEIKKEEKNFVRAFSDLIWQPDQISLIIESHHQVLKAIDPANTDRWGGAPRDEGRESWGRGRKTLAWKAEDMFNYAFEGGSWNGGSVPKGGRAKHLDSYARDSDIPETPAIAYVGDSGFPLDGLKFESSAFEDPDGAGTFGAMEYRLAEITPVGGGEQMLVEAESTWSYLDDGSDQGSAWAAADFDDGAWKSGPAQFGYGDRDEATVIDFGGDSSNKFITTYFRLGFDMSEVETFEEITIAVQRDDGVVIYVNGQQVLSDNMPNDVNYLTPATAKTRDEDEFYEHVIGPDAFQNGNNIVAVELHQASAGDSDTSFDFQMKGKKKLISAETTDVKLEWNADWESGLLDAFAAQQAIPSNVVRPGLNYRARVRHMDNTKRWSHWSAPVEFVASGPDLKPWQDGLVISEIMYNPLAASDADRAKGYITSDFEFVEVMNRGPIALDLASVRFTKGVDFDFSTGNVASIEPGAVVLVVRNREAFESRYGAGLPIAGTWGEDRLANGGERLKLSFGAGLGLRDFDYDDKAPWPATTDGDGFSLVLKNPASNPDHSDGNNWIASSAIHGNPGTAEGGIGPVAPVATNIPEPGIQTLTVNGVTSEYLTLTYRQEAGETFAAEISRDLVSWEALGGSPVSEVENDDGSKTIVLSAPQPIADEVMLYLRLRSQ